MRTRDVELRNGLFNLRASNLVSELLEKFNRTLQMNLRVIESS